MVRGVGGYDGVSVAIAVALLWTMPANSASPRRVASLDLCTDEMLVELADPRAIASLSPLAHDPALSNVTAVAAALPDNHGSAEEILREGADLVLAEPGAAAGAVGLLRRLGVRVELIDEPGRLAEIAPTIRHVAAVLDRTARGEELLDQMRRRLAALPAPATRPTALFYDAGGWSSAAGTLSDDVLTAAGFANYATALGVTGAAPALLETIVAHPPDFLVTADYRAGEVSLAETVPGHPALQGIARHLRVPTSRLICATPDIVDGIEALAVERLQNPHD